MPNPYNPNPYNEDQDRARQQPLYDQPGGPRQDASQEYHKGDGVFQIPWWVIVITFCFAAWPIGVAMIIINHLLRMGKISAPQSWSQNNRQTGQPYTVRPIYADPQKAEKMRRDAQRVVQRAEEAAHKAEKRVEIYQNADRAQAYDPEQTARQNERGRKDKGEGWSIALTVLGVIFSIAMVANLPEAVYWLPEALTQGGSYWTWLFQDLAGSVTLLFAGAGFLFAGWKLRTGRRMRKKISNIVGNAPYMKIQEIADAIPCNYAKCCKHLENCIDKGVFGENAYLDMRTGTLVVRGAPPAPQPAPAAAPKAQPGEAKAEDNYAQVLNQLRALNDAIPGEEMSDKISRLEAVSAKIFAQAKQNPDKLPQMRKFMDYYLPTALKLLKTYAELDAQGVEGENIRESKQRIEQVMDTLVTAFEAQLDRLFEDDALDVSTDIDVMENMLRADGLTGNTGNSPKLQLSASKEKQKANPTFNKSHAALWKTHGGMAFVFMVDRFREWRNFYMLAATAAAQAASSASWVAVRRPRTVTLASSTVQFFSSPILAAISLADIGAQLPFSTRAKVRSCRFRAFRSSSRLAAGR